MNDSTPIPETDVAKKTGITPEAIAALRKNEAIHDEHWKKNGRQIVWTALGVQWLSQRLSVAPVALSAPVATPEKKERRLFFVAKLPMNRMVLLACPDRERKQAPVTVRVRSNEKFSPGTAIFAEPTSGPNIWSYVGRYPTFKGQQVLPKDFIASVLAGDVQPVLEKKGGDAPCPVSAPVAARSTPSTNLVSQGSNAAPEQSNPSQDAAISARQSLVQTLSSRIVQIQPEAGQ